MNRELITYTNPKSPVSEMFKTLRTNIQFMNSDRQLKTLLVSSTLPGEGKSWTAANLAVAFSQAGKKVLVVDADMRKGRQFNIFGVSPTPGLSNYLSGVSNDSNDTVTLDDVIQDTDIENLYVLAAGNVPPNPSELLISERMLELIDIVRKNFDITIFDGTPSLIVTDAPILARIVDSTILVTAHNETKIDDVTKVKKSIENIGGKVAGVVVNKIPLSAKKYENTYYYGSTMPSVVKEKKRRRNEFEYEEPKRKTKENKKNIYEREIVNKSRSWEKTNSGSWKSENSNNIENIVSTKDEEEVSIEDEIKENWNKIENEIWDEDNTVEVTESAAESLNNSNSYTKNNEWNDNEETSNNDNKWESDDEWTREDIEEPVAAEPILSWEKDSKDVNNDSVFKSFDNIENVRDNSNDYSYSESSNNTSVKNSSRRKYSQSSSKISSNDNDEKNLSESTQDVINQLNKYLQDQKSKLKNGDTND